MILKGLKFGKKKDGEKGKPSAKDAAITNITELEGQLKDRTEGLAQTEKKLERLSGKVSFLADAEVTAEHPHGPIGELSIEPLDSLSGVDTDEPEDEIDIKSEEEAEVIDVVKAEPEPPPAAKTEKTAKTNLDGDSLKALFTSQDEDENPLASLINSLPDITIDELMDDLKEIKDIIRDWQKK